MNTTQTIIHTKYEILSAEHPAEAIALRTLALALAACLALYLYFVSTSVFNVIAREEAQRDAAMLEGSVGTLQREYFALAEYISEDEAMRLGLSPLSGTSYVRRPANVGLAETRSPDNAI